MHETVYYPGLTIACSLIRKKCAHTHSLTHTHLSKLSFVGDPSIFGNLPPHPAVIEGVKRALESGKYHGYGHSSGLPEVRAAVAKEFSRPGAPLMAQVCSSLDPLPL